jgi:hypothetical protein
VIVSRFDTVHGVRTDRSRNQPQAGAQIGSDRGGGQPGLVDLVVAWREPAQTTIFAVTEAVFDAGMGAVAGFPGARLRKRNLSAAQAVPACELGCSCYRFTRTEENADESAP